MKHSESLDVKILGFAAVVAGALACSPAAAQTIEEPARSALVAIALDCEDALTAEVNAAGPDDAVDRAEAACDRALRYASYLPPRSITDAQVAIYGAIDVIFGQSITAARHRRAGNDYLPHRLAVIAEFRRALNALDDALRQ